MQYLAGSLILGNDHSRLSRLLPPRDPPLRLQPVIVVVELAANFAEASAPHPFRNVHTTNRATRFGYFWKVFAEPPSVKAVK